MFLHESWRRRSTTIHPYHTHHLPRWSQTQALHKRCSRMCSGAGSGKPGYPALTSPEKLKETWHRKLLETRDTADWWHLTLLQSSGFQLPLPSSLGENQKLGPSALNEGRLPTFFVSYDLRHVLPQEALADVAVIEVYELPEKLLWGDDGTVSTEWGLQGERAAPAAPGWVRATSCCFEDWMAASAIRCIWPSFLLEYCGWVCLS